MSTKQLTRSHCKLINVKSHKTHQIFSSISVDLSGSDRGLSVNNHLLCFGRRNAAAGRPLQSSGQSQPSSRYRRAARDLDKMTVGLHESCDSKPIKFKNDKRNQFMLLKFVVETMVNAIITRKKWLNGKLMTKKPQSTDEPVLKLLLYVAHAALKITSTSANHRMDICKPVFKLK